MTLDPNTGLPKLPDRYFWRVERRRIEVRKRRFWRFSVTVYTSDFLLPVKSREDVISRAQGILEYIDLDNAPYLGDFPPKKLESA